MCIEQVPAFRHAGKLYDTELKAVEAAIQDIGSKFIKQYHNDPLGGLIALGADVSHLRARYLDLLDRDTATEVTSENVGGEPKKAPRPVGGHQKHRGVEP